VRLNEMNKNQQDQGKLIADCETNGTQMKFLGFLIVLMIPTAGGIFFYHLNRHNQAGEKIQTRLEVLENFKTRTDLQMPLVTETAQALTASLVTQLHHPDQKYAEADALLDKIGGEMSTEEHLQLASVLRERENDQTVRRNEREAARALPAAMNLVRKLIDLQQGPLAEQAAPADCKEVTSVMAVENAQPQNKAEER
jgi:hypothetical protein